MNTLTGEARQQVNMTEPPPRAKGMVNNPPVSRFEVPEKGCYDEDCEGERVEEPCGCWTCTLDIRHDGLCRTHAKEERAEYLADVEKEK